MVPTAFRDNHDFLEAIGVQYPGQFGLIYIEHIGGGEYQEFVEFGVGDGYLKFDTDGGDAGDNWCADQFEAWLKANNLKYFRGYPDEPDDRPDRRFCLGKDAVEKLQAIRLSLGITDPELLNNA